MGTLNERWRTSSHSNGGECVEVRLVDGRVEVRDSTLGEGSPILGVTTQEWSAFVAGTRDGEFDR